MGRKWFARKPGLLIGPRISRAWRGRIRGLLVAAQRTRRLATADELAGALHVGRSTVFRWAAEGRIPSIREGRTVRFDLLKVFRALGIEAEVTDGLSEGDTSEG